MMSSADRRKVTSVQTYIDRLDEQLKGMRVFDRTTLNPWFRGQPRLRDEKGRILKLRPSLYRGIIKPKYERHLVRDFSLNAGPIFQRSFEENFECLAYMQHYGAPTRLLDWTENALVALYFAVVEHPKADARVWILDAWSLNERTLTDRHVPTWRDDKVSKYFAPPLKASEGNETLPIAFRPIRFDERVLAQRSMFTVHGSCKDGLEDIVLRWENTGEKKHPILRSVTIAGSAKGRIQTQLDRLGVTVFSVFRDRASVANEVKAQYSNLTELKRTLKKKKRAARSTR
jgi:hypothetical protein